MLRDRLRLLCYIVLYFIYGARLSKGWSARHGGGVCVIAANWPLPGRWIERRVGTVCWTTFVPRHNENWHWFTSAAAAQFLHPRPPHFNRPSTRQLVRPVLRTVLDSFFFFFFLTCLLGKMSHHFEADVIRLLPSLSLPEDDTIFI